MVQNAGKKLKKPPVWALWLAGLLAACGLCAGLAYYWRVFYYLDARGVPALAVTGGLCALGAGLYLAASLTCRFVKSFEGRAALCILVCGALFVFADPPMQPPDEQSHYLRAYAVSMGRFDFDAARGYPESVDRLLAAFPGAWVNGHTSVGVRPAGEESGEEAPAAQQETAPPVQAQGGVYAAAPGYEIYDSSGCALKQYGEDGAVTGVADGFAQYFSGAEAAPVTEPLIRSVLQYLPAALLMALARLAGFQALGCLYAGRLANLCVYTLLCWLALKNCKRYQPVFLAVMLLPMSLYMAGSLNYDAILLGCYYFAASYYCRDEITDRSLLGYMLVFWLMNLIKPWINLLWLALPLVLPGAAWKAKLKKWQLAVVCVLPALALTQLVEWYGNFFVQNYGEVGRMLPGVDQIPQLKFVLANPLRYLAVLAGTLYENNFFLGQLGVFGALDLSIPLLNLLSPCMLLFGAALSVHERSRLRALPAAGLGGLAVVYTAGVMTALYITYTPVGMVRILGLQARYLLPVFLMLAVLLAALLSHVLEPRQSGEKPLKVALGSFGLCGAAGAVLLFQHYFIGPVYTI